MLIANEMTIGHAGKSNIKWDKKPIPPKNIIQTRMETARLLKRYLDLYCELKGIVRDDITTMNPVPKKISKKL